MGYQPTLGQSWQLPAGNTLTLTGSAPTVQESIGTFSLSLQGYAPFVDAAGNTTLTPGKGTLFLGLAADPNVVLTPPSVALSLTALTPTVINPSAAFPGAGSLTLQGYAPTPGIGPASTTGVLTLTGAAPSVNRGIVPPPALLKVTPVATIGWVANTEPDLAGYKVYRGLAPRTYTESRDVGNVLFYVWNDLPSGTNYFAVTAYDTAVPPNESGFSDEVSAVISGRGFAPTITIGTGTGNQIDTAVGSLSLTSYVPVVSQGVVPPVGSLTLTGYLHAINPDTGALVLTGLAPVLSQAGPLNETVVPPPGSLTLTGYVKLQIAEPLYGILTLQGYTGTVTVQVLGSAVVVPPAGSLTLFSPTVFQPRWARDANKILAPGGVPEHA
jgi:hypothetical protein